MYNKLENYIKNNFNIKENLKIEDKFYKSYISPQENFPIIDKIKDMQNCYVNIGTGKNGILFSVIGGKLLKNLFEIKD